MTLDIIPRIPELWGVFKETVSTDLGLDELLYLGTIGSRLDMTNVKNRFVGRAHSSVPSGSRCGTRPPTRG
jgi:hypothetical protein